LGAPALAPWKRHRIITWQRRGHQLGEIDLSDLLLGEHMVHAAFRIESEACVEAMRAIAKLRIDAHDLWLGD
jgi:hypothetical protein